MVSTIRLAHLPSERLPTGEARALIIILPSAEGILTFKSGWSARWEPTLKAKIIENQLELDTITFFSRMFGASKTSTCRWEDLDSWSYAFALSRRIRKEWAGVQAILSPISEHPEINIQLVEAELQGVTPIWDTFNSLSASSRAQILVGVVAADITREDYTWTNCHIPEDLTPNSWRRSRPTTPNTSGAYWMHDCTPNQVLLKKLRSGEQIVGYHGTAASHARKILQEGFTDHVCVEGVNGTWFWDSDVSHRAHIHGKLKAMDLREDQYAVIAAELNGPMPDRKGREQWLARAEQIGKILSVEFHPMSGETREQIAFAY